MFANMSIWGILLAALSAMVIGTIWYSSALFGKQWKKMIGTTDAKMKQGFNTAMPLLALLSLLTAYMLSLFILYFHAYVGGSWLKAGVGTALLVWFGFGLTTIFAHGVFEPRDTKLLYINSGNRLVTFLSMGLIISAFMK